MARLKVETYYDYVLASERWQRLRERLLRERGRRCEDCGVAQTVRDLDLHHKTYERLGWERDDDLQILCRRCHWHADRDREEAALYRARLIGWAHKRYGEMWWYEQDVDCVQEEFDDWLERHEDD